MTKIGEVIIEIDGESRRFRQEMKRVERHTRRSNERMRQEFRKTSQASKALTSAITRSRTAMIALNAAAVGALSVGAVRTFMSFERTMSEVKAVTQATGGAFEDLNQVARELGASTTFSASEVAQGMVELGRAGLETNEIIEAIPTTLKLAQAGVLDLASASDILTNVAQGFGLAASEAERVGDVLAKTAATSNTDIQGLGYAMAYAAPLSNAFGVSLEQTAAAIGLFSNNGIKGSAAGTAFRQALVQLHKETPKGRKALREYNLTYADLNVEARGLVPVLEKLAEANISASDAAAIFQSRAAGGLVILARQIEQFKELEAGTVGAIGTLNEMSDTLTDNLWGSVKELTSAWEEMLITIGESIAARAVIEGITDAINALNRAMNPNANSARKYVRSIGELETKISQLGRAEGDLERMREKNEGKEDTAAIRLQVDRVNQLTAQKDALIAEVNDLRTELEEELDKFSNKANSAAGRLEKGTTLRAIGRSIQEVPLYESEIKGLQQTVDGSLTSFEELNDALSFGEARAALFEDRQTIARLTSGLQNTAAVAEEVQVAAVRVAENIRSIPEEMIGVSVASDSALTRTLEDAQALADWIEQNQTRFELDLAKLDLDNLRDNDAAKEAIDLAEQEVERLEAKVFQERLYQSLIRRRVSEEDAARIAEERTAELKAKGQFKTRRRKTDQGDDVLTEFSTDLKSITKRSMKEAIIEGDWNKAFEEGIRGAAASGLERAIDSVIDVLFDAFSGASGGGGIFGSIFGNIFSGGGSGKSIDGALASGGPVRTGGTYLVGEEGPELFTPNQSGHIVPNGTPINLGAGGGGGGPFVVNANLIVQGHVTDDFVAIAQQQLAMHSANLPQVIRSEVRKSQRRGGI